MNKAVYKQMMQAIRLNGVFSDTWDVVFYWSKRSPEVSAKVYAMVSADIDALAVKAMRMRSGGRLVKINNRLAIR